MTTAISEAPAGVTVHEEIIRQTELEGEHGVAYAKAVKITYTLSPELEKEKFVEKAKSLMGGMEPFFEKIAEETSASPLIHAFVESCDTMLKGLAEVITEAEKASNEEVQRVNALFTSIFDDGEEELEGALNAFTEAEALMKELQNSFPGKDGFERTRLTITTDEEDVDSLTIDYRVVYGLKSK